MVAFSDTLDKIDGEPIPVIPWAPAHCSYRVLAYQKPHCIDCEGSQRGRALETASCIAGERLASPSLSTHKRVPS